MRRKRLWEETDDVERPVKRRSRGAIFLEKQAKKRKLSDVLAGSMCDEKSSTEKVTDKAHKKKKHKILKDKEEVLNVDSADHVNVPNNGGLEIVETVHDNSCVFRAFAHQLYGDEGLHGYIQNFLLQNKELARQIEVDYRFYR